MSISAIGSIDLTSLTTQTSWQSLQKVGQDLKSGNLSAAQTDFATLMTAAPSAGTGTPLGKAAAQLGQDLQAGNLSAAQQDYATLKQDLQSQATSSPAGHHHHHGGASNAISQLLNSTSPVLQAYLGASNLASDATSTLSVTA